MSASKAIALSLPAIIYALVVGVGFTAMSRGQATFKLVHFPLELIGIASIVASVVIVFRLFPQLGNPGVWLPFALNALVLIIFIVAFAVVIVRYAI